MRNKVITTTTNSIENAEVEKYIDLVSTNVVIGTNAFSDIGASLTDFFGGFSDTYQNKLQEIYGLAIDNLKLKASNIGANAILGLKIDFDEISGRGKSMFMISALGTAVKLKFNSEDVSTSKAKEIVIVSNLRLEQETTKRQIIKDIENGLSLSQEEWVFLFNNPIEEITEKLIDHYITNHINNPISESQTLLFTNLPIYLRIINEAIVIDLIYKKIKAEPKTIINLISKIKLFSPVEIIKLIKDDQLNSAIECIAIDKEYYSTDDLKLMQEIIYLLDNLQPTGRIEMVKGILGKSKEKFICQKGHSNDANDEYCQNIECYVNIKGLTRMNKHEIETYKSKVKILHSIFNEE